MRDAPPGFIPTPEGDLLNVRSIGSVSDLFSGLEAPPNHPITCVTCEGGVWYFEMSVQQFAARMVEALAELEPPPVRRFATIEERPHMTNLCTACYISGPSGWHRCTLELNHTGLHRYEGNPP